jgi:hypothetical protein
MNKILGQARAGTVQQDIKSRRSDQTGSGVCFDTIYKQFLLASRLRLEAQKSPIRIYDIQVMFPLLPPRKSEYQTGADTIIFSNIVSDPIYFKPDPDGSWFKPWL